MEARNEPVGDEAEGEVRVLMKRPHRFGPPSSLLAMAALFYPPA
jgi:hypothetical protein